MPKHQFSTEKKLTNLIDEYFKLIEQANDAINENLTDSKLSSAKAKKDNNCAESPTITGLALHLGFNSLHEFEDYEINGQFSDTLKRGRLRIEAAYEKKLHQHQPHTGIIFALRCLGWGKKTDKGSGENNVSVRIIKIEVVEWDPTLRLASAEDEVML